MNQFELATKLKLRFPYRGMISVEDLWDLSMEQLDVVYKALKKEAKQYQEDSLLDENNGTDDILDSKLFIVQYIFNQKKDERQRRKFEAENAARKQRILEVIAKKQDDALMNASEEELMKMLENIG